MRIQNFVVSKKKKPPDHAHRRYDSEPNKIFAFYDPTHGHRKHGGLKLGFTKYVAGPEAKTPKNACVTQFYN